MKSGVTARAVFLPDSSIDKKNDGKGAAMNAHGSAWDKMGKQHPKKRNLLGRNTTAAFSPEEVG